MRRRHLEGTRAPLLYAVGALLHYASMRDRLDPDARYRDGEVALAAAIAEAVTTDELEACRAVAAGANPRRLLGPEPSPDAIELARQATIEAAGVRWRGGRWAVMDSDG